MPSINHAFRDRLLEVEPVTPALKERYEKEVQVMFQKKLTRVQGWAWLATSIGSLGLAIVFAVTAVLAPSGFPLFVQVSFVVGAFFGLAFAALGLSVYMRGSVNLKTEGAAVSGLAWGLPVVMLTLFMMFAPEDVVGLRMITCGLVFLVMGAVFLLRHVVEQSELKTREKLLEIEYRLAEVQELVKSRQ